MFTLYNGRFHTRVDDFEWLLPSDYAGTHLLKQLAAKPATAEQIAHHQIWGPATTAEILDSYKLAGLVQVDEATGIYSLNVVTMIELLDAAWLKFPQEAAEETWVCDGKLVCDGADHGPIGYRGPEIGIGCNGPIAAESEADDLRADVFARREVSEQESAA